MMPVLRAARAFVRRFGFDVVRYGAAAKPPTLPDIDEVAKRTIAEARPYTMASPERLYAFIEAVRFVCRNRVAGAVVECGVWRGGSMMAAAKTLLQAGEGSRDLYLFDTFEGMSEPGPQDIAPDGRHASRLLQDEDRHDPRSVWCHATLDDVQATMAKSGYDPRLMHFVEGKVEDTVPASAPEQIAVLRLDTDWYESTRHEMEHLYPRLRPGGVLIIDDYGHWAGSRKAVDEYLARHDIHLLLQRTDYTGRMAVKPG